MDSRSQTSCPTISTVCMATPAQRTSRATLLQQMAPLATEGTTSSTTSCQGLALSTSMTSPLCTRPAHTGEQACPGMGCSWLCASAFMRAPVSVGCLHLCWHDLTPKAHMPAMWNCSDAHALEKCATTQHVNRSLAGSFTWHLACQEADSKLMSWDADCSGCTPITMARPPTRSPLPAGQSLWSTTPMAASTTWPPTPATG